MRRSYESTAVFGEDSGDERPRFCRGKEQARNGIVDSFSASQRVRLDGRPEPKFPHEALAAESVAKP